MAATGYEYQAVVPMLGLTLARDIGPAKVRWIFTPVFVTSALEIDW
jgi:hypothetical protein